MILERDAAIHRMTADAARLQKDAERNVEAVGMLQNQLTESKETALADLEDEHKQLIEQKQEQHKQLRAELVAERQAGNEVMELFSEANLHNNQIEADLESRKLELAHANDALEAERQAQTMAAEQLSTAEHRAEEAQRMAAERLLHTEQEHATKLQLLQQSVVERMLLRRRCSCMARILACWRLRARESGYREVVFLRVVGTLARRRLTTAMRVWGQSVSMSLRGQLDEVTHENVAYLDEVEVRKTAEQQ